MRVLVVCTGNSCRSALAEALWRHHWDGDCEVRSAGSAPTGQVHPLVPEVLRERGIDASGLVSEPLSRFEGESFDLVVTVCDEARESCQAPSGGVRTLHWPFPDPAVFTEGASPEDALQVFRSARDTIEGRILRFRDSLVGARGFGARLRQIHAQLPAPPPDDRSLAFLSLVEAIEGGIVSEHSVWEQLPAWILERYAPFGWGWNGIYRLRGLPPNRRLELAAAAGPPVCATIDERPGGFGVSGMCFDAIHAGHPLVAADVKSWPGYVSCDGESGLGTVAGIAVPIAPSRAPIAVWDLDSTAPLDPSDGILFGALWALLPSVVPVPKEWLR